VARKKKGLERRCFGFTPISTQRQARRAIERESFERPVMIDFFAHWCPHCGETAPELDDLSGYVCDDAKVMKVDVDTSRKLAEEFQIEGLPTVAVFHKGKLVNRSEGYKPAPEFLKMLEQGVGGDSD
jgi:thioredoxin 1